MVAILKAVGGPPATKRELLILGSILRTPNHGVGPACDAIKAYLGKKGIAIERGEIEAAAHAFEGNLAIWHGILTAATAAGHEPTDVALLGPDDLASLASTVALLGVHAAAVTAVAADKQFEVVAAIDGEDAYHRYSILVDKCNARARF